MTQSPLLERAKHVPGLSPGVGNVSTAFTIVPIELSTMVRHKVMTTVSTFDGRGNLVRDHIKIGGRIKIARSRIEVNCDVASAKDQVVVMIVDVDDDGRGTVNVNCPTTLVLTINKPDQKCE